MLAMLILAMAQSVTGPPGDEEVATRPVTTQRHCERNSDEILVCAGGAVPERLVLLPDSPVEPVFKPAVARISPNKTLSAGATAGEGYAGPVPRIMAGIKIDF